MLQTIQDPTSRFAASAHPVLRPLDCGSPLSMLAEPGPSHSADLWTAAPQPLIRQTELTSCNGTWGRLWIAWTLSTVSTTSFVLDVGQ